MLGRAGQECEWCTNQCPLGVLCEAQLCWTGALLLLHMVWIFFVVTFNMHFTHVFIH